jgi:hypothetical protein
LRSVDPEEDDDRSSSRPRIPEFLAFAVLETRASRSGFAPGADSAQLAAMMALPHGPRTQSRVAVGDERNELALDGAAGLWQHARSYEFGRDLTV